MPSSKRAIESKWVYKVKLNVDGTVEYFFLRSVSSSKDMIKSLASTTQVFSPVAKLVTVGFLIALATLFYSPLHQIDVNNAFFAWFFLHDEIYDPPQGYHKAKSGQVCKLIKRVYGLKQASHEWHAEFCRHCFSYGFTQSCSDNCLFIKGYDSSFLCLLVHVDDVLITSPNKELIVDHKLYSDYEGIWLSL